MKLTKLETNAEKAAYHKLMTFMYEQDISLINAFNKDHKYGGFTVAFNNVFPGSKMVEVAVSFCDAKDKYLDEVGNMLALDKFEAGELIQLPIGYASKDKQAEILYHMFAEAYRAQ